MAPLPDAKHLLELLQRAADELKQAQKEAAAARAETNAARAETVTAKAEATAARADVKELEEKLKATELALRDERRERERLEDVGNMTLPPGRVAAINKPEFTTKTVSMAKSPLATTILIQEQSKAREDKTNVNAGDENLLGDRMKGLQDEIRSLEQEKRELKDRVKSLESELANPEAARAKGELEHELSNTRQQLIVEQARGADLMTRLQAWEARSQELEHSLANTRTAADQEHQQLDQLAGQLSQVETELTTERARTGALEDQLRTLEQGSSDEQKKVLDATSRVAQLEIELAGLKQRRDELNIEIGKVESDRKAQRARVQELETEMQTIAAKLTGEHEKVLAAELQKKSELEQAIAKEKEKHQITAQKLLEARGKQRDADDAAQLNSSALQQLNSALEAEKAAHAKSLADLQLAHEQGVQSLQAHVLELTNKLENATAEWRHTDRQYEALHKELLVVLDQRDQARLELDSIKARLGLRT
ncbi:MAG: hypothetical protein QM817_28025 [Archangium sp.]